MAWAPGASVVGAPTRSTASHRFVLVACLGFAALAPACSITEYARRPLSEEGAEKLTNELSRWSVGKTTVDYEGWKADGSGVGPCNVSARDVTMGREVVSWSELETGEGNAVTADKVQVIRYRRSGPSLLMWTLVGAALLGVPLALVGNANAQAHPGGFYVGASEAGTLGGLVGGGMGLALGLVGTRIEFK